MIFKTVKTMVMAFTLIAGIAASLTAEAVVVSGTLANVARPSLAAVDSWRFTCPIGTVQVRARIMDNTAILNTAANVYVSFGKDATSSAFTSDSESTTSSSPWVTRTATATTYALAVSKSAINAEDYSAEVQCLNSSLVELTTTLVPQINE
jgi:hypothetical protein